jgi:hypothetical protein
MIKYSSFLISFVSLFLFSCINEEGEGGVSIIEGSVFKVIHSDDIYSFDVDTIPASKEDVYIVYGDDAIYGDKMETGYDGFFRFKYLTKGTYKIYAYSTLPDLTKVAVIDTITVANGETKQVQNIYIHEGKSYQTSFIKGKVLVSYYDKNLSTQPYIDACDVRVYIKKKGGLYQFDEIRTGLDGVFVFQNLYPGEYEVFVLTEMAGYQILSPISKFVTIKEMSTIVTIEESFQIIINA